MPRDQSTIWAQAKSRPDTSRVANQLLETQRRAHDIDARERDRIEGMRKSQRDAERKSRLDASSPSAAAAAAIPNSTSTSKLAASAAAVSPLDTSKQNQQQQKSQVAQKARRLIHICSSADTATTTKNGEKIEKFPSNSITTSRYSLSPLRSDFIVWKNLWEQFHRRANWFFLFVGIIELVPQLSALSQVTLITLTVVLLLGMIRSMIEDLKRQAADRVMNKQPVLVIKSFDKDKEWRSVPSSEVSVGDIVLLESSAQGNVTEAIPCDLVLLSTSELDDTCAVQSAHVDGEAKWSMKRALPATKLIPTMTGSFYHNNQNNSSSQQSVLTRSPFSISSAAAANAAAQFLDGDELGENFVRSVCDMYAGATISVGQPDGNINEFSGTIRLRSSLDEFALRIPQLLLRGTQLRKAKWVVGACVYTGNETKALMGHELPTRKWSRVENVVNTLILTSLGFYLAIVIAATVVGTEASKVHKWYLPDSSDGSSSGGAGVATLLFSFIIFFDNAIPISLYVSLEIVELITSFLIEMDLCLYDSVMDRRAAIRAPELLPDLGQVNYLFCDKTGTITRNELSLRKFSVQGDVYGTGTTQIGRALMRYRGEVVPDAWRRTDGIDDSLCPFYDPRFDEQTWFTHVAGPHLERLFTAMAVCHTANISLKYQRMRRRTRNPSKLLAVSKYDGESPDELALCEAARKFGIEFMERKGDAVAIEGRNGSRATFQVRDVLPFTSERMRMSVLVELADGTFKLFCKGADSVIFPLSSKNNTNNDKERLAADQLASEGLRTLVFAERKLSSAFVTEWLRRDKQVQNVGDFYFDSTNNLRKQLAAEIEKDLTIIGVTGMEDMLQYGVPECFTALRGANIKTWLVTGDSREAAINIGYSCGLIPVEAHILELYGVSSDNVADLREALANPVAPVGSRTSSMRLSRSASLAGSMRRTNHHHDAPLLEETPLQQQTQKQQEQQSDQQQQQEVKLYVAILDGVTFATIDESTDEPLQKEAYLGLSKCASVLCARFSSSQKAKIVQFVSNWSKKLENETITSVAVGDGTNDIPMLRAANVGIGMFGVESFDAANAGDFAIAQFWFLQRLLLHHGRSSYRRFALVIKYFLYKNLLYVLMLFFFAMQSDWSPQAFIPSNLLGLYNILFTSLPIVIAGVVDRDVFDTDYVTRHFQELYWPGQRSAYLNLRGLLPWIANAIWHAVVCYFLTQVMYDEQLSSDGVTMGADASALTTYTAVVILANTHLGFHLQSFTGLTFLGFWLSVIGYFFFMMLYSALPPTASTTAYRAFNNVGFQANPWIVAFLALQVAAAHNAFSNYFTFNLQSFARMSLKRVIQLADSANSREASTRAPYEIAALQNNVMAQSHGVMAATSSASKITASKNPTTASADGKVGTGTTTTTSTLGNSNAVDDADLNRQLNFFLQFKDGETEEQFIESYLGNLTRYKVGAGVSAIFSGGITVARGYSYLTTNDAGLALLEVLGWALYCAASIGLLAILFWKDPSQLRHYLHQVMLLALLIAFGGMSMSNFVASQRQPDTHPVSMAVAVFGLLVVVRPPLVHIVQYLVLGVTSLAMWYQIFRVKEWTMSDILLRTIEFVIVFIISLIGLVVGEKFDRKLYVMQLAIKKSMALAAEAERRSLVLLNNVLPSGIVAEMSNNRVSRNLSDFSVTLPDASVLQSDIVSFTLFSSTKQPHAVVEMLNSMFKKFDAHVSALGIEKIKTVGDAYVCAAGVPCPDRHHAEKIVSFGLRMVRSIWELNKEGVPSIPELNIQIRVGAASGPVRAGVIAMEKMRYELFGAVAEECEKMEQTGRADRVQVTHSLYSQTRGAFEYEVVRNTETGATQYFVVDKGVEPFFSELAASQLVTTNRRSEQDRFRILEDDNVARSQLLGSVDPASGGKLNRWNLNMRDEKLEKEFRAYYMVLADARTNTETAQSTIMYALVASIVAIFVGSIENPVVILQLAIACILAGVTLIRVGVPFFREFNVHMANFMRAFESIVGVRGGFADEYGYGSGTSLMEFENNTVNLDHGKMPALVGRHNSTMSSESGGGISSSADDRGSDFGDVEMAGVHANSNPLSGVPGSSVPLPDVPTVCESFRAWITSPKTTVYTIGILTLADPLIVLFAVSADGISRVSVFIILAAASFIFSQMHLLFLQKIALASVHLVLVSIAFFVRTAVYEVYESSRDGGDVVGIICCYILSVGAAYTTERSVRKAFVASKRVERRNAEIGRTLHLCEKLLNNSIPVSIVRRLQEAPDRAVVDEIPEASVLFLYIDGVIPHEDHEDDGDHHHHHVDNKTGKPQHNNNHHQLLQHNNTSNNDELSMFTSTNLNNNSSSAADDDTADVVKRMNDVFYVLDALCRYHQVEKIKTLPFLVVSGCPEPLSKHCYRLACLAKDALAFAQQYNSKRPSGAPELRIKAGLHTGRVTAGVLGTSKFVYDVFGDTVNLASRLSSNAIWGTAACSEMARRHLACEGVTVTPRGEVFMKGKGKQLVFQLNTNSLRVPTPSFVDDIDAYLLSAAAAHWQSARDPHTTGWSMRSSNMSDRASLASANNSFAANNNNNSNTAGVSPSSYQRNPGQFLSEYKFPAEPSSARMSDTASSHNGGGVGGDGMSLGNTSLSAYPSNAMGISGSGSGLGGGNNFLAIAAGVSTSSGDFNRSSGSWSPTSSFNNKSHQQQQHTAAAAAATSRRSSSSSLLGPLPSALAASRHRQQQQQQNQQQQSQLYLDRIRVDSFSINSSISSHATPTSAGGNAGSLLSQVANNDRDPLFQDTAHTSLASSSQLHTAGRQQQQLTPRSALALQQQQQQQLSAAAAVSSVTFNINDKAVERVQSSSSLSASSPTPINPPPDRRGTLTPGQTVPLPIPIAGILTKPQQQQHPTTAPPPPPLPISFTPRINTSNNIANESLNNNSSGSSNSGPLSPGGRTATAVNSPIPVVCVSGPTPQVNGSHHHLGSSLSFDHNPNDSYRGNNNHNINSNNNPASQRLFSDNDSLSSPPPNALVLTTSKPATAAPAPPLPPSLIPRDASLSGAARPPPALPIRPPLANPAAAATSNINNTNAVQQILLARKNSSNIAAAVGVAPAPPLPFAVPKQPANNNTVVPLRTGVEAFFGESDDDVDDIL